MPEKCVVYGCSNSRNVKEGISLHGIPFSDDERAEAKKRRRKWVDFVSRTRSNWKPTPRSVICSKHFKVEDFSHCYANVGEEGSLANRWLKRDELGIAVFPSIHLSTTKDKQPTPRDKRMILKRAKSTVNDESPSGLPSAEEQVYSENEHMQSSFEAEGLYDLQQDQSEHRAMTTAEVSYTYTPESCANCLHLKNESRKLSNSVKTLRAAAKKRRAEIRKLRKKVKKLELDAATGTPFGDEQINSEDVVEDCEKSDDDDGEEDDNEMEEDDHEMEVDDDEGSQYNTETECTDSELEDDLDEEIGVSLAGTNIRSEPKHIVFLSQLLLLFQFCHSCKTDNPAVEITESGTNVTIKTSCHNVDCKKESTWHSQPFLPGSFIHAGNFLLPLAVVLSGGSAAKVVRIFAHMGVGCISLRTFFRHQRVKIFPTIQIYWKKYHKSMMGKLKEIDGGVVIAGDGRHDSMGHSAKFCAYTIFCCTIPMIIHFDMVQRNQAGSSPAMEFLGFRQCMEYLIGCDLLITTFVSDRHTAIACHMRKVLKNIIHYFDIWHIKKKIRKVLSKLAKEKGYEAIADWIKPCENHLHWSATSTHDGNGIVMWAKFKAFMSHVINKHSDLDDPVFNKCAHGEIGPKKWLTSGSVVHERLCDALTKKTLVKAIKQASPLAQTSSLEGFHSVLNHFAPKMLAYSYRGMYCRHILAVVHYNKNLHRDNKHRETDKAERVKVIYPKFKNGEATVRNVKIKQDFSYVEEIFQTFMEASKDDLKDAAKELKEKTPPPMNTMLQKQPRAEALQKRAARSKMVTDNIPPTTPVSKVTQATNTKKGKERQPPKCSLCKQPMKGHKNVTNCPKNINKT